MAVTDKYELVDFETFTFKNDGTVVAEESVVTITANDTVGLGSAENPVFGKVWRIEDRGNTMVQYSGIIVAKYSGAAPTAGSGKELVVDGAGAVKVPATAGTGTPVDILSVDTANTAVVFVLR